MTFDDLKKLYWRRAHKGSTFPQYETPDHDAALRSVVAALRDEIEVMNSDENLHTTADVLELFDEILGDAGEKAAGDRTRESAASGLGYGQAPAADPSPAVCEWSVSRDPDGEGHYETKCGNGWMMAVSPPPARDGYKFCPSCGKPISFREK